MLFHFYSIELSKNKNTNQLIEYDLKCLPTMHCGCSKPEKENKTSAETSPILYCTFLSLYLILH